MTHIFGLQSKAKLNTVHKSLQDLFYAAIGEAPYDFSITEGLRSLERQKQLFRDGKSKTMNSRHLTGNAVDVCIIIDGKASWDFDKYVELAEYIKKIAKAVNVPIVWGGDWQSFRDGPHYELDRKVYP
jgi:peptidoglycan L-alanyl-D-glutamate endopeptidase CwlK